MKITNKSAWPTFFCEAVVRYVARRLGRPAAEMKDYEFTFRGITANNYRGRGGTRAAWLKVHRRLSKRAVDFVARDHRFAWAPTHDVANRIEAFVFLVAHEMRHGHADNAALWRGGRRNRQGAEHDANQWAADTVLDWRRDWKTIRAGLITDARQNRAAEQERRAREAAAKAAKNSPEAKLAKVFQLEKAWTTKAKRAATALKKLRRKRLALTRVIDGRMAANGAPHE